MYFPVSVIYVSKMNFFTFHRNIRLFSLIFFGYLLLLTMSSEGTKNVLSATNSTLPMVINTWGFVNATLAAKMALSRGEDAMDAVVAGCTKCEEEQCDGTVGFGGSPDENGETTLDALVMDGGSMNVGAVGALRRVKNAVGVARAVLERTRHTLLVGSQATEFAKSMGFQEEDLSTPFSLDLWKKWRDNKCQPNFWTNVTPNPNEACGPYKPNEAGPKKDIAGQQSGVHDTIGLIVIDKRGHVVAGTSTNGAIHKIPGRVGDSPIPGSGAYADDEIGGAAATGDGDVMMRFLPSYQAVENMRHGMLPENACADAVRRIVKRHPSFSGAVVATRIDGVFGAACHGMESFPFSVWNPALENVIVKRVGCL